MGFESSYVMNGVRVTLLDLFDALIKRTLTKNVLFYFSPVTIHVCWIEKCFIENKEYFVLVGIIIFSDNNASQSIPVPEFNPR